MERLLKSILTIREIKFRMDDDYVDRLNRQYTIIILISCGHFGYFYNTGYLDTYILASQIGLHVVVTLICLSQFLYLYLLHR